MRTLNVAISWTRNKTKHRERRQEFDEIAPTLQAGPHNPSPKLEWLYDQIAQLNELDRSLTLLLLDGFIYRDMASVLGISESNGGVRINRIKARLTQASRKASLWLATNKDELLGRISPDGRWVAYLSNETGSDEVFVRPFTGPSAERMQPSGGKWQVSRTGIYPTWREDSRELFYMAGNGDVMSAKVSASASSFVFQPPQKLFTLPVNASFEVAENGSRILALVPDAKSVSSPITVVLNWKALLDR